MNSAIHTIKAREILDSRGNPTVEVTVILNSGYRGIASVPSGASVSKYEAVELRDKDANRYDGLGVTKAVQNVNTLIADKLVGQDATKQANIDQMLVELDGTPNKAKLGANATLGVSMAAAAASAHHFRMPLYMHLNKLINLFLPVRMEHMPAVLFNVINGGKHGGGSMEFQEFHLVTSSGKRFVDTLEMGATLYHSIKKILKLRGAVYATGDEGGFAPNLDNNAQALDILTEAVRGSRFTLGVDVSLGLDIAAGSFKKADGYILKDQKAPLSSDAFVSYLKDVKDTHELTLIEDPLEEDDMPGWSKVNQVLGTDTLIVADDLVASNAERLSLAIEKHACSAVILKPNQIGTISELLTTVTLAKKHNIKCIVSHRSGDTTDSFVSDLAVAIAADYVKFGAPDRGERVVKYNRLLQIESELFPVSA